MARIGEVTREPSDAKDVSKTNGPLRRGRRLKVVDILLPDFPLAIDQLLASDSVD
jgi:hypothetical protein